MSVQSKVKSKVKKRPAETVGLSLSAVVAAVLALFKVELEAGQVAAIVFLLGAVPGVITWFKARSDEKLRHSGVWPGSVL